jgi:L-arabinokinase
VTIAFYVSSHGFGHACRSIELIAAIQAARPDTRVVMLTSVAPWFVERSRRSAFGLDRVETDTGLTQLDSLHIDHERSAKAAAAFYAAFDERVAAEAARLRAIGAALVVGDVPPLAFAAAEAAGVPSIAVGNFTWDWIYADDPAFARAAPGVVELIAASYRKARLALRLPLHGGFAPMAAVTRDVPFIARRSRLDRGAARERVGLPAEGIVVLASFGAYGAALPYETVARSSGFTLVLTDHEGAVASPPPNLVQLTTANLTARGLRYEDLVSAADVVLSKPGYGIVSECIANGAALLYTSRGRFIEYDVFTAEMPGVLRCRLITQEDLSAGRWQPALDRLLAQPKPPGAPRVDGAEVAAEAIFEFADAWPGRGLKTLPHVRGQAGLL